MGQLGEDIKNLGFGLMRLPTLEDGTIDVEQVKVMTDKFLEAGFTYFDTAWAYPGSEEAICEALVKRYPRDSYTIATKNAAWIACKTREDALKQFDTSLERLGVDYIDFYLLHNIGEWKTQIFEDWDMWSFVKELKEQGKVKHWGFSFHSTPEELEEVLTKHPDAEFVQLQINYADWENPEIESKGVYEVARKHNKPVVIMEPVKGGALADPPEQVAKILKEADPKASCASWALRFAADLPGLITVLSGMSTVEQMDDNLSFMKDFKGLTEDERKVLDKARDELNKIPLIPCTSCNYCAKACPMEIGISGSMNARNHYTLFRDLDMAKGREAWLVGGHGRKQAVNCIKCGACEKVCPQHINIREHLTEIAETFAQKKAE